MSAASIRTTSVKELFFSFQRALFSSEEPFSLEKVAYSAEFMLLINEEQDSATLKMELFTYYQEDLWTDQVQFAAYTEDEEPIILQLDVELDFHIKNMSDFVLYNEDDQTDDLPDALIGYMISETQSTARGILYTKTAGSYLGAYSFFTDEYIGIPVA